ncbi:Nramp family divalent metal transporter [Halobacillus sp. Nhm2S1]|uniref:Nramp family divalent metal transporter n=1 Tax=Halobacillus sp. Nhm2S1 TaxID=2866716 RepID=UPI001C72DCE6|nr:Nramp family divalent metal transporter [Halobacillus sp. Nhm2S1]MBX0356112.1 Nramp family divalent metal transporter [Halobacillus sp. Nhm2S1]
MAKESKFKRRLKNVGPGAIVAAAIVGPGTVTTASNVGAQFGYALIWALVFSVLATMFLQEMVTRLGVITRKDLSTILREQFSHPVLKWLTILLIISAIVIGSAAYEAGNIVGGAIGLSAFTPLSTETVATLIGLIAGILLWVGKYKIIERVFIVLILTMTLSFVITAIVIQPDLSAILTEGLVPKVSAGNILLVISLIGTTIVPYTLFLQSSVVQERFKGEEELADSRFDVVTTISICGIISVAIIITAAVAFPLGTEIQDPSVMADQLKPLLGSWAKYVFAVGIFAAGISSAMTAPLASAYATAGALGWERNLRSTKFRLVWIGVLLVGVLFASLGYDPIQLIVFAQYANGLILPFIVLFLMMAMNNRGTLRNHVNSLWVNIVGGLIFLITVTLSLLSFGIF